MRKSLALNLLLTAGSLILLTSAPSVSAQTIYDLTQPLVDGQRALKFRVDTHDLNLDRLWVRVFYSGDAADLNDLDDNTLSRGKAVLEGGPNFVFATFVFPHHDHMSPNRSLYIRRLRFPALIRYPEIDIQISRAPNGNPDAIVEDSPIDVKPESHRKGDCVYYRIQIKTGEKARDFTSGIMFFRMPDTYNIGMAGDSYGSGEGAPGDAWEDKDCHRSNRSGLTRGVKKMIHDYPDIAVDYRNVACSGAVTSDFRAKEDETFGSPLSQLLGLSAKFHRGNHTEMHLMIMSIGGNDAGFGSYVINFYIDSDNAAQSEEAEEMIDEGLDVLPGRYRALDRAIESWFPTADVAISTYPDPTNGPWGRCGTTRGIFEVDYYCCQLEVDRTYNPVEEYEFSSESLVEPLNEAISDAAEENGWRVINVGDNIGEHGVCNCAEPYIHTLGASLLAQGDVFGFFHPNDEGYKQVYRDKVRSAAVGAFEAFEQRRTLEMLVAALTDDTADDAVIPTACPPPNPTPPYLQRFRIIANAGLSEHIRNFPVLTNLLADERAREAINRGDLKRLEALPTYQAFWAKRAEIITSLRELLPKRSSGPKANIPRELPPSVIDAEKRADAHLKSPEFEALKFKIKATMPRQRVKPKRDLLDELYNRPIVRTKRKPRRLVPRRS